MSEGDGKNLAYTTKITAWSWHQPVDLRFPVAVLLRSAIREANSKTLPRPVWFLALSLQADYHLAVTSLLPSQTAVKGPQYA